MAIVRLSSHATVLATKNKNMSMMHGEHEELQKVLDKQNVQQEPEPEEMKISLEKPPIFDKASKLFGVKETDPIFYTYGDTIYSPAKKMPPDDLIVHEQTHAEQQGYTEEGAKEWWATYFIDPNFRISQEAEAYGLQYRWLCGRHKDRNKRARILHELAAFLSSDMYGKAIRHTDAMKLIRDFADGKVIKDLEAYMPEVNDI